MPDIFDVIADATRRELLRTLLERYVEGADAPHGGEMSVGELVQAMALSQPTVSKHLKVLRDFHLVSVREQGQHRFYRLDYAPLEEIEDWLLPFLSADFEGHVDADDEFAEGSAHRTHAPLPGPVRAAAHRVGAIAGSAAHALTRLTRR